MQYVKDQDKDEILQKVRLPPNMSPVSFFAPDFKTYPKLKYVEGDYHFILQEGDCVYIPAFYFY